MLEDDVRRAAELCLDGLAEAPGLLEAGPLLVGGLAAAAHHSAELGAVDVAGRAELLDQLALLVAGDHADRVGAADRAQLGGEHAEAAGGAPDQDPVAGLEPAAVDQHPVGGEVGQAVGGGLLPGQVGGLGQQLLGLDLAELGKRAPARLVTPDLLAGRGQRIKAVDLGILVGGLVAVDHHLVAGLPPGHALADLPHDPRCVGATDVVVLVGVVAEHRDRLAQRRPDVVEVHARRPSPGRSPRTRPARAPPSPRAGRRRRARPGALRGSPRPPSSAAARPARSRYLRLGSDRRPLDDTFLLGPPIRPAHPDGRRNRTGTLPLATRAAGCSDQAELGLGLGFLAGGGLRAGAGATLAERWIRTRPGRRRRSSPRLRSSGRCPAPRRKPGARPPRRGRAVGVGERSAAQRVGDRRAGGECKVGEALVDLRLADRGDQRPVTATPKVPPTIRLIESTPEATPALVRSTAFMAAVLIGDIVKPIPRPMSTSRGAAGRSRSEWSAGTG